MRTMRFEIFGFYIFINFIFCFLKKKHYTHFITIYNFEFGFIANFIFRYFTVYIFYLGHSKFSFARNLSFERAET